jgi:enoyl-CoA hydratase/carnithine racemase
VNDATPVGLTLESPVARLTLDRRARRNAANRAMVDALGDHLLALQERPDIQVLVLQGQPGAFCAGWDIDDLLRLSQLDEAAAAAEFARNEAILDRLESFPGISIAAVDGAVVGFGLALVARCDFAIATERSTFAAPELQLGLAPAVILRDLRRTLGARATMTWLLDAAPRSALQAQAAGLLHAVCPDDGLAAASGLIERQAGRAPAEPLRHTKTMLRSLASLPDAEATRLAIAGGVAALRSPTAQRLINEAVARRRAARTPMERLE